MRNYKTVGIVLKRSNFKETDKILTILSREHGRIRLIAKGIRRTISKKAPSLEPFSLVKLDIAQGKNLDLILEVEAVNNFLGLRQDLKKIAFAYQICELVDRLCPERQINRSLFDLVSSELLLLEKINGIKNYKIEDFELKLLWDLGYLPKDNLLRDNQLDFFMESVMERKLKSKQLLTKIDGLIS
ncbi:DNA repair protein RecO, partial [Candidatus Gottesmanbacteria bacterium]|nr:DNA repair protein RecO [Candidatus Gottesmanbacteria bacterium]